MSKVEMASRDIISLRFEDGLCVLQMNAGENRFNPDFVSAFNAALDEVERNQSCRALITTGTGKFFSNGLDLAWVSKQDTDSVTRHLHNVNKLIGRILCLQIPTIAAINGHSFAAGGFLALAHDFRVMRRDQGWICLNEIHIKMVIRGPILQLVRMKAPWGPVQRDMVLFGKRYTAEEGVQAGIIDEAAEQREVIPKSKALAERYLTKQGLDRATLQKLKQNLLNRGLQEGISEM